MYENLIKKYTPHIKFSTSWHTLQTSLLKEVNDLDYFRKPSVGVCLYLIYLRNDSFKKRLVECYILGNLMGFRSNFYIYQNFKPDAKTDLIARYVELKLEEYNDSSVSDILVNSGLPELTESLYKYAYLSGCAVSSKISGHSPEIRLSELYENEIEIVTKLRCLDKKGWL